MYGTDNILSEVSQAQKDKIACSPHMQIIDLKQSTNITRDGSHTKEHTREKYGKERKP
jgi:hypothetical protein